MRNVKLSVKYELRIIICNFSCPQQTLSCLLNLASQSSLFSPWCSLCCGKCPPFGSFYPFLAHSAIKMVPVSAILSPPCSLPPSNVLNSCLLSLLHVWFSDSGINKKICHGWMGAKLRNLSKGLLLKCCLLHHTYLIWRVWRVLVRFWRAHGCLGSLVTWWGRQEAKVLGCAVYCSLEGLSWRLFSCCPWAGKEEGSPLLCFQPCVIRTGNWVKWSLKQGCGWVLLNVSWAHGLLRVFLLNYEKSPFLVVINRSQNIS